MASGKPNFSLICYKAADEPKPVTVIPLDNARVVIETGVQAESGILVSIMPLHLNMHIRSCWPGHLILTSGIYSASHVM